MFHNHNGCRMDPPGSLIDLVGVSLSLSLWGVLQVLSSVNFVCVGIFVLVRGGGTPMRHALGPKP